MTQARMTEQDIDLGPCPFCEATIFGKLVCTSLEEPPAEPPAGAAVICDSCSCFSMVEEREGAKGLRKPDGPELAELATSPIALTLFAATQARIMRMRQATGGLH